MKTTNTSGTNNLMYKKDNNKGRYSRQHHRYNNSDNNSYDQRARHTAKQSLEKYLSLAREATVSGDKIAAEHYFQHADHFHRVYNGLNSTPEDGEKKNNAHHRYPPHRSQRPSETLEVNHESHSSLANETPQPPVIENQSPLAEKKPEENLDNSVAQKEETPSTQKSAPSPLRPKRGGRSKKNTTETATVSTEESSNPSSEVSKSVEND